MSLHVAMLLTNPFHPDPRVHKEARSLVEAGYRVTVICWDRKGEFPPVETLDGIDVVRIHVASTYGAGSRQILRMPVFWMRALGVLQSLCPDIIHCHDLDTALAGWWYIQRHHVPWVLDAHECYPEQVRGQRVSPILISMLLFLERAMVKRATRVITVGNLLAKRFRAMGGVVSVVGNYQPLVEPGTTPTVTRESLGLGPQDFVVAYIGTFIAGRAVLPLIHASAKIPGITVLLLGDGPQREAILDAIADHPRIRYLGRVSQAQVPDYTALADVLYYGLDASVPDGNIHYSSPNALFNAMMAGRPMLTTNIGEIAQIVRTEDCGVIVDALEPEVLVEGLRRLQDPVVRKGMGSRAYLAAQAKYNWGAAETCLLEVYRDLADLCSVPCQKDG